MAEFHFSGIDELSLSLQEIAEIPEDVVDEMLNAQADVVVAAQKRQATAMGIKRTGKLIKSLKKGRPKRTRDGSRVIYVTASGTRKSGKKTVRNAEIAFVTEFGRKGQKARPFISTANEQSAAETTKAAAAVHSQWLQSKGL